VKKHGFLRFLELLHVSSNDDDYDRDDDDDNDDDE